MIVTPMELRGATREEVAASIRFLTHATAPSGEVRFFAPRWNERERVWTASGKLTIQVDESYTSDREEDPLGEF